MSVDQLPDRLNLSSFVGDDFSVLIEFVDETGAAFDVAVTDLEATLHRDPTVPLTLAQTSPSSVTLSATDVVLGDTVRTDDWSLRYTVTDRTWFAGNFAVTDSVRTGTFGNGDVLSVTVGTAAVQAVVTAVGPQGVEGPQGPAGATGPAGSNVVTLQEEGVTVLTAAGVLNFVGASVTVTDVGGVATITITGTGGSTGPTDLDGGTAGAAGATTIDGGDAATATFDLTYDGGAAA